MSKLHRLFQHHSSTLAGIIILAIGVYVNLYTGNSKLVLGNFGQTIGGIFIASDRLFWLVFASFVKCFIYKNSLFGSQQKSGLMGGMFGIFGGGCPSCSLTLATSLGLGGILSRLPYGGFELKIIGLLIVSYSLYNIWNNLESCAIKKKPTLS